MRCAKEPLNSCMPATHTVACKNPLIGVKYICTPVLQCRPGCTTDKDCGGFNKCVKGVCQSCGTDSDCTGGYKCIDISFATRCSNDSDCPGTVGVWKCQK